MHVILISGGTSGIGLDAASKFLQDEETRVVIMGRSEKRGSEALRTLGSDRVLFVQGDVKNPADCQRVVRETEKMFGRLDVLVNSAGIYLEKAIEDTTPEELADVLDTNVKGTYFLSQAAMPLLKQSRGNIVNVASDAGLHGNYFCTAYCASKGAVVLFTRALALETAAFGVRVNAIAPGDIRTPMTQEQLRASGDPQAAEREMAAVYPLGRIGEVGEASSVIVFLASNEAAFVTGAVWNVDGGLTA